MLTGHKLLNLREYHRPAADGLGLDRVLELLARPAIRTAVLAGGDTLLASGDQTIEAVVDLQGLGLDGLAVRDDPPALHIGALATRAAVAAWDKGEGPAGEGAVGEVSSPLRGFLGKCARRWGGSVQRNRATVGGALAVAAGDDALVAALLVCDAEVLLVAPDDERAAPIAEFLAGRAALFGLPSVITGVRVPLAANTGYALETVGRTPADAPIVLAAAAVTLAGGVCTRARLAVGGMGGAPARLPEVEAPLEGRALTPDGIALAADRVTVLVNPTGDFRGSSAYRRAMAGVLARRALSNASAIAE